MRGLFVTPRILSYYSLFSELGPRWKELKVQGPDYMIAYIEGPNCNFSKCGFLGMWEKMIWF